MNRRLGPIELPLAAAVAEYASSFFHDIGHTVGLAQMHVHSASVAKKSTQLKEDLRGAQHHIDGLNVDLNQLREDLRYIADMFGGRRAFCGNVVEVSYVDVLRHATELPSPDQFATPSGAAILAIASDIAWNFGRGGDSIPLKVNLEPASCEATHSRLGSLYDCGRTAWLRDGALKAPTGISLRSALLAVAAGFSDLAITPHGENSMLFSLI